MGVLSDRDIANYAENFGMITPFVKEQITHVEGNKVVSFGCGSYGYDVRLGRKFKVFDNWLKCHQGGVINPKTTNWHTAFTDYEQDEPITIPPNSFCLGESVEVFDIPRNILVICLGKSTFARCGLIVNVTPGEPEWKGKWTIEISNTTPLPAVVFPNEGIMQAIFLTGMSDCSVSYKDKAGKYQNQTGLTMPGMKKES